MGVVGRVHVVMLGSRGGWVGGDGELDIDVHGGVGGAVGFHSRVLDQEVKVGGVDFVVVECVGVSDESTLSDPTCGCV